MRRSAAPSFKASAKRLKFISPLQNSASPFDIDKENDLLNFLDPEIAEDFNLITSNNESSLTNNQSNEVQETEKPNLRSTSEVLQLILGAANDCENIAAPEVPTVPIRSNNDLEVPSVKVENISLMKNKNSYNVTKRTDACSVDSSEMDCSSEVLVSRYNVLWCKRSMKKHKIWEGDGILIVRNRSAVLKDSEGKEIDRGMGYKLKDVSSLEEGSKFCVGGKECEIQNLISSEICSVDQPSIPEISNNSTLSKKPTNFTFNNGKHSKSCM